MSIMETIRARYLSLSSVQKRIADYCLEHPDEELDLDYVQGHGVEMNLEYALSNSLGFGGHNASILIKKYAE